MTLLSRGMFSIAFLLTIVSGSLAHHGWSWTTGGNIDLTGIVQSVKLGNPHGIVTVDADGELWTVEVGQPWRNERAGLKRSDFAVGNELRFIGEPSADKSEKRLKAERVFFRGKEYQLYPRRD